MEISIGDIISSEDIQVPEESKKIVKKTNIQIIDEIPDEIQIKDYIDIFDKKREIFVHPTVPIVPIVPIKGRLCLNMIVKNESRIIERLLESVLPIIDTYCICDTGSTDDTPQRIRDFMSKHNKPGIVFLEPFKNFGYNRSVALDRASVWGEYVILLDADMKLMFAPEFLIFKQTMNLDGYHIVQQTTDMKYYNTRIIKTGIGVKCVSPTHEYYDFPSNAKQGKIENIIYINDIGDGGCKSDKFTRDIRLLKEGLEEEPTNPRYHFYIANSYKNIGQFAEAIEWYKKRVALGGWYEEVFYSLFEIGNSYNELKEYEKAIFYWLEAWNKHPRRAESLYEVVKHYRIHSKHQLAQTFCDIGKSIPFPKEDMLFIKHHVYDRLFDYEQSVLYYYTKKPIKYSIFLDLIGKNCHKHNVLDNYQFYTKKLKDFAKQKIDFNESCEKSIKDVTDNFVSSSPCIIPDISGNGGYMMNIRFVNYTIQPNGSYTFRLDDGKIRTLNKLVYLNKEFKINESKTHFFDVVHNPDLRYQGVEDVRVFKDKNELIFTGTVEGKDSIRVGHGKYDLTKKVLEPIVLESPYNRNCEKNWVLFSDNQGAKKVIYDWKPLTIGELSSDGTRLTKLKMNNNVPEFFSELRGSTNGQKVGDELWFLCHIAHYSVPRHYYHVIIVLDAKTLNYKKNSILFKFEGEKIEYALGMIVEPKQVIFSYSTWDRTSSILTVSRNKLDEELFV
jgi:tetratricopeptide (TPR) repeat protein